MVRTLPLLLHVFFWSFGVLKTLPGPRQSHVLPGGAFLNVRGLYLPAPVPEPGFGAVAVAFALALLLSIGLWMWSRRRQELTGRRIAVFWPSLLVIVALTLAAFFVSGSPL